VSGTDEIKRLSELFKEELSKTPIEVEALDALRINFIGKKGSVTNLMKQMGSLSPEERPLFGKEVNILKTEIESALDQCLSEAKNARLNSELEKGWVDVTLPPNGIAPGSLHPLNQVRDEIIDFFFGMGFELESSREVETDWYNFEALNIPPDHPARDMQDTFYVDHKVMLRTHTSGGQIHVMEHRKPPFRIIETGHVYRVDADATHAPMFQQVEGLVVDRDITFGHLKGILYLWAQKFFGENVKMRFRPSFFPFTEPSAEVDISCVFCGGEGCRRCSQTGWMEIGGCGSVDPNVFKNGGVDPEEFTGFAFGFGLDRMTMLRYQIPEIGLLTGNDQRFLRQF
jgi:phenylalanyl-tRNA synthetase alpha chain